MAIGKPFTTFAQYNEDLILAALFSDDKKGFYVDVGANHPIEHSVTKHFYDLGWSGINVEPNPTLAALVQKRRPRDTTLQVGVSNEKGELQLRIYHSRDGLSGLSTFSGDMKNEYLEKPRDATEKYTDVSVPIVTLASILTKQKVSAISFLKIDVEGFEYNVLEGMDWGVRPEVVCIEANHITKDWRPLFTKQGYQLFIQDGLNNYYVANEAWERTEGFAERAAEIHYTSAKAHQTKTYSTQTKELTRLYGIIAEQQKRIEKLEASNVILSRTSLSKQTYIVRIKRAIKGLTIGWLQDRKK